MCGEYDNLREGSLYSFRNYLTLNARYLITSAPASRGSDPVPKEYAILYHFLDSKTNLILVPIPLNQTPSLGGCDLHPWVDNMSKPCLVLVTISLFHVYVEILRTLKLLITASRKNFTRLLNENDFFRRIPTDLPLLCFYEYCKYIEIFARFYWRCKTKLVLRDSYSNRWMIYIGWCLNLCGYNLEHIHVINVLSY